MTARPGRCAICGAGSRRLRRMVEGVDLHRCDRCACEFLWPPPSDAQLAREYAGYYERRATSNERPKAAYFEGLLSQTGVAFDGKSVLEIGSGEGDCVAALNRGWPEARVTAVEAHPDSAARFQGLRCEHRNESVETWLAREEPRPFDVVLMFDLLEHLRDPVGAMRALARQNLAPGARLVATFPNVDSTSRRALGRLWPQYKLEHLFYFSRASIERIALAAGLRTISLEPLTKRLPLEYLLTVGSGFGPRPLQNAVGLARRLTPSALTKLNLSLRFGEWIWIARK